MPDPRDYKLDLSTAGAGDAASMSSAERRPFLSVHFACCGAYQRVYRNEEGTAYQGRCPRCAKPVRFPVGSGGTACRTFRVS